MVRYLAGALVCVSLLSAVAKADVFALGRTETLPPKNTLYIWHFDEAGDLVARFPVTTPVDGGCGDLAMGPDHNLYFANGNVVQEYDRNGNFIKTVISGLRKDIGIAGRIAVAADGSICVSARNAIARYSSSGTLLSTYTDLMMSNGLTLDGDGRVYSVNEHYTGSDSWTVLQRWSAGGQPELYAPLPYSGADNMLYVPTLNSLFVLGEWSVARPGGDRLGVYDLDGNLERTMAVPYATFSMCYDQSTDRVFTGTAGGPMGGGAEIQELSTAGQLIRSYSAPDMWGIWSLAAYTDPSVLNGPPPGTEMGFNQYLTLEANFGKSGATWEQGDFTGDSRVDFKDYLFLESKFGTVVPEPGALLLLVAGGIGLILRRSSPRAR